MSKVKEKNNSNINVCKTIEKTAKETAKAIIEELKVQNMMRKELGLYRFREIENEDMKLKIEEMKIGEQLGAMEFKERVQTSIKCKNNDYVINEIDKLKKKIKLNEIANKRVDNALRILEEEEREIVKRIFIDKKSISKASQEFFKSRKSIANTINKATKKIKLA